MSKILEFPIIEEKQIHIWFFHLDNPALDVQANFQLLDTEEKARSARFHFEHHQRRFVLSHGLLRKILAAYLHISPNEIAFRTKKHGKPFVPGVIDSGNFYFNLAHSHEVAVVAVTRIHEIGVDVEYLQPKPDLDQIVTRFFSHREQIEYQNLPSRQKMAGFYNAWTRKEAFIKAVGEGLSCPLETFDVTLTPEIPVKFLRIGNDPDEASRWTLESFSPSQNHIGAVAIREQNVEIKFFEYDPAIN